LLWKGNVRTLVFAGIVIIIIAISLTIGIEIGIEKEKTREKNFPDWLCQECNLERKI
jgi:predicted ABC-type exoprotein transport system permease subunit